MSIFPVPASLINKADVCDYSDSMWIRVSAEFSTNFKNRVVDFKYEVSQYIQASLDVCAGIPAVGKSLLIIELDTKVNPQSYVIDCQCDSINLTASDEAGAFYGLKTLAQIFQAEGAVFKGFKIEDGPEFIHRGIMFDVSRTKVPTMETLYQLIDLMSVLKLNELQLYTEHTFAFSAHQRVWAESSPITAEEILELDSYCKERYIELVPNLNSFGHFQRWLKYPEYQHLAECPDGFVSPWGKKNDCGSVLKPNQASLDFIDSLYCEMLPNFSSKFFNVGCDETWELGTGWSKKQADEIGATRVYFDFLIKIAKLAKKHNRTMQFWGDIIIKEPSLVKELPKDIIALEWGYEADSPYAEHCKIFKESNVPFYVCPGTSSWNSITGRVSNCLANIENAAKNGLDNGSIGLLNTDWGDGGHHQYMPISYVGYFAGAAFSWNLEKNRNADLSEAINRLAIGDATNSIAQILMEFGDVYLGFINEKRSNDNIISKLFTCDLEEHNCQNVTNIELNNALEQFAELKHRIKNVQSISDEVDLVKAEILNGIAMASFAMKKGIFIKDNSSYDKNELQGELSVIIGKHQELWLRRNRVGGLQESCNVLKEHL